MKILIVDDDRVIHLTFTKPLIENGHEVFNVYDGQEALDMAVKHKPDIIVLDVTMPHMDGRDICKKLKASPETQHIKIIMLSARNSHHDRILGLELGADEYLSKPCSISHLERIINKIAWKQQ